MHSRDYAVVAKSDLHSASTAGPPGAGRDLIDCLATVKLLLHSRDSPDFELLETQIPNGVHEHELRWHRRDDPSCSTLTHSKAVARSGRVRLPSIFYPPRIQRREARRWLTSAPPRLRLVFRCHAIKSGRRHCNPERLLRTPSYQTGRLGRMMIGWDDLSRCQRRGTGNTRPIYIGRPLHSCLPGIV